MRVDQQQHCWLIRRVVAGAVAASVMLSGVLAAEGDREVRAGGPGASIGWGEVRRVVETQLSSRKDFEPSDLLSRSQVSGVLQQLAAAGWSPDDRSEIEADTLPDNSVLVRTLRSPQGVRFMRKVAGQPGVYDRLDRIASETGGEPLLVGLVRLPDAERFTVARPARGLPDLVDFLPKNASGKTRTVKDFGKPTGRVYTAADLVQRLESSYRRAAEDPDPPGTADR